MQERRKRGSGSVDVREWTTKDGEVRGAFVIRFRAKGRRHQVTLGGPEDGWTYDKAEEELEDTLVLVRKGLWHEPKPPAVVEEPVEEPSFHEFASTWFAAREAEGLASKTLTDLRWSLVAHLLPHFADFRLSQITPQAVDVYKTAKAAERKELEAALVAWQKVNPKTRGPRPPRALSNSSINHTLRHLAQICEVAVEYGLIQTNPATGRRRRLKTTTPARPWVEPEQLMAFLDTAPNRVGGILLALLAGAGLRIGEALALRWRDVDLGTGTLYVRRSKTDAGVREVHLTPALRELLALWRADTKHPGAADYVVCTAAGRKHNPSNLRRDVLAKTVAAANVKLEAAGIAPIGRLTFHGLRRTYASLRCICGDDPRYTADQLGHTDARFTLRCYAQAAKRRDRMAPAQRRAFDRALEWAQLGASEPLTMPENLEADLEASKNPA